MSRFLVTGGCGFAGSHIVEELLRHGHEVTVLDKLTYAGPLGSLAHLACGRLRVVYHDFSQPLPELQHQDYVVHNGAESHVFRSLEDPGLFVRSNVIGMLNLLEWARNASVKKFVYVSTDEVFGPAGATPHTEAGVLCPTNPYAATKAGGEFLAHSYFRSFGIPVVVTRTVNLFGERQHPEKFVPMVVKKLLEGNEIDIHVRNGEIGSRNWVYAGEQARALSFLAEHGLPGTTYHVSKGRQLSNFAVAEQISKILGLPFSYRLVESNRPGHDLHYSIRESPQSAAWKMPETFHRLLTKTVLWYRDNPGWLAT